MKIFHCDHCQHLVFFENVRCLRCEHALAFFPDLMEMGSQDASDGDHWYPSAPWAKGKSYRLCRNYQKENVCNWVVPAEDPNPLCHSCRLSRIIPDLSVPGNQEAWYRLEAAKRRLVYTLLALRLPIVSKLEDPANGMCFEFLADPPNANTVVLTGHSNGVITLNVAEADDAEREKRRRQLNEPYRTVLGHFRHEVGHYYWDRLIKNSDRIQAFRKLFGDEREDYDLALKRYYEQIKPAEWQKCFVSAYASSHTWEDWAETWAHYLHMIDTTEIASNCGLSMQPRRQDEPGLKPDLVLPGTQPQAFDPMIERWFPLTYLVNNLNRGLGFPDAYPFVLSPQAIEKLRFVHDTVASAVSR